MISYSSSNGSWKIFDFSMIIILHNHDAYTIWRQEFALAVYLSFIIMTMLHKMYRFSFILTNELYSFLEHYNFKSQIQYIPLGIWWWEPPSCDNGYCDNQRWRYQRQYSCLWKTKLWGSIGRGYFSRWNDSDCRGHWHWPKWRADIPDNWRQHQWNFQNW